MILAVPCCQHELLPQLASPALDPLLRHGTLRERFAAEVTDAARAQLLGAVGYDVQVVEFVELEHTPKNILLRAVARPGRDTAKAYGEYRAFAAELGIDPALGPAARRPAARMTTSSDALDLRRRLARRRRAARGHRDRRRRAGCSSRSAGRGGGTQSSTAGSPRRRQGDADRVPRQGASHTPPGAARRESPSSMPSPMKQGARRTGGSSARSPTFIWPTSMRASPSRGRSSSSARTGAATPAARASARRSSTHSAHSFCRATSGSRRTSAAIASRRM